MIDSTPLVSWISGSCRLYVHGLHQPGVHSSHALTKHNTSNSCPLQGCQVSNCVYCGKKPSSSGGPSHRPPSLRLCQCETTSVNTFVKHFLSLVQHYASRWPLMKSLYAQCNMHPFRGTEITSWCRGLPKTSSLYSPRFSFFRPMCAFIISSSRNNPTNSQTIYRPRQFAGNSGLALQSFTCWFNHKGNGLINDISL